MSIFDDDDTDTRPTGYRLRAADGRMMYPIGEIGIRHPHAWVDGIDVLTVGIGHKAPQFLLVPADRTTAEYTTRTPGLVTGFRRRLENPALPEFVSRDEWDTFSRTLGYDDEGDPMAARFYERVHDDDIVTTHAIDLIGFTDLPVDIESIDDPDETLPWDVSVAHLVFGTAYGNALPGVINGVGERIAEEVKRTLPHATVWTHKAREAGTVSGYITLTYEDGRTYPIKDGRRTVQRPSTKNFEFDFRVPRNITAKTKAEAVAQYRKLVDEIVSSVETSKPVVCAHCNGDGVLTGLPVAAKKR